MLKLKARPRHYVMAVSVVALATWATSELTRTKNTVDLCQEYSQFLTFQDNAKSRLERDTESAAQAADAITKDPSLSLAAKNEKIQTLQALRDEENAEINKKLAQNFAQFMDDLTVLAKDYAQSSNQPKELAKRPLEERMREYFVALTHQIHDHCDPAGNDQHAEQPAQSSQLSYPRLGL